jgi:hypothetical protein
MIPLETDGSTFHKHYEPTSLPPNGNCSISNKMLQNSSNTAVAKVITPTQHEDDALESLTLEFKTLLKHVSEYLKAQK